MNKKIFIIITGLIILTIGIGIGYFFLMPRCPESCDDGNPCTKDTCSKETDYKCSNIKLTGQQPGCLAEVTCGKEACKAGVCQIDYLSNCCGNKICETEETYETCSVECPNCDDDNKCTKDSYDYHQQKCVNSPILDVVCCGNATCETGETYQNCSRDCPNCDDENKCTKDSYDYYQRKCLNKVIIPCCGNKICDKGAETYSNCSTDCPSCDDNNRLTADSFNYTTQKCENIATHYFIDDFEEGSQRWSFYDSMGQPNSTYWSLIRENNNRVLKGTGHSFADLTGKKWDNYALKFKFKRIKGSVNINFRNNFFTSEQPSKRYMVSLGGGGWMSLQKGLNESEGGKGITEIGGQAVDYFSGWHTLEIGGYQDILNIYLDGNILIKFKDTTNPILSGKVSFETLDDEGGSEFLFDDVEIKIISEKDIVYP